MGKKAKWFEANASEDGKTAKITIDGEIGFDWWDGSGVTSRAFMNEVKQLGDVDSIEIDMNSPGGSVSDGLTIANYLKDHPANVTVNVLGQASSIASVIACAADTVNMGLGAFMFVHKASSGLWGNADNMQAMANDLGKIDDGILDVYVERVGEDNRETMVELIAGPDGNGTLLDASYAQEIGLADTITETRAAASFGDLMQSLQRGHQQALEMLKEGTPGAEPDDSGLIIAATAEQRDALAKALGVDATAIGDGDVDDFIALVGDALSISTEGFKERHPEVHAEVLATLSDETRAEGANAERDRVMSIARACATVGSYDSLEKMVAEDWDAQKASDFIISAAASSSPNINSSHSPNGGHKSIVNTNEIYARRKSQARK
ncbi:MAG: head maturation protease, ClpP-related [Pseudomonadota bacterium]